MADLRKLEFTYPKSANYVFEDLCTHLFCTELGLRESVNRRPNQRAIESDSVFKNGRTYGYQAKYYQAGTRLQNKRDEFISSVEGARRRGVTVLKIYVNQPNTEDPRTQEDPAWMKEVHEAASGRDGEPEVKLDWWFLSKIEDTLDMPRYRYIRDLYFSGNAGETSPSAYYDHVCDIFANELGSELFGEMPLRDSYIEPTVDVEALRIRREGVREFIESWVDSDGSIAVICGEPGHGKTALCQKAMYDFYEDDWLSGKVSNVLRFSLNPANTDALANGQFYLYSLLSWGDDRRSPEQRVSKQACTNALVFLDGFDELLEWHPRFDLERFIKDYILKFQEGTRAHVIITSRNMVVEPNKTEYTFGHPRVPIVRLQPIPKEQQLA